MIQPSKILIVSLGVALLLHAQTSFAVAYCALRDPVNTIYSLFPEANSYRSSVQTIGREAREAVAERLPFELHFNELGRHTLYIALKNGNPVGFVHARSEAGGWGITEFAWALELDLSVRTVKIQRSRDPSLRRLSAPELMGMVGGRSLESLLAEHSNGSVKAKSPRQLLLASAMKTLVITETVWPEELITDAQLASFSAMFSGNVKGIASVDRIERLYDERTVELLSANSLAESPAFMRDKLTGYNLKNNVGETMAVAVQTPFDLETPERLLWWLVSPVGKILNVIEDERRIASKAFAAAVGNAPVGVEDCSTLVDLAALEMSLVSLGHSGAGKSIEMAGDLPSDAR